MNYVLTTIRLNFKNNEI